MGSVFPLCAEISTTPDGYSGADQLRKQTDGTSRYEELRGRSEASAWMKNRQELLLAVQRATQLVGEDPQQKLCLAEGMTGELNCSVPIRLGWIASGNGRIRRHDYHSAWFDRTAGPPSSDSPNCYAARP